MKLGVSYIIFDGVELLESSILQIRNQVDWISVIYQGQSWFGDRAPTSIKIELNRLVSKGLIDELVPFTNFTPLPNRENVNIQMIKEFERNKRQLGLSLSLRQKCTHYLCMDIDEFYLNEEFKEAKRLILNNGYTATSVSFINYVKTPTIHRGYDPNRVPFICKIDNSSQMVRKFFVRCDPTRGISNCLDKTIDFDRGIITMHHMETVRRNLTLKYLATTRGIFDRNRTSELVNIIEKVSTTDVAFDFNRIIFPGVINSKLTHCENIFNIPYENWK